MEEKDTINCNLLENNEKIEEPKSSESNKNQINQKEYEIKEKQNKNHENSENKKANNKEENNNIEDDSGSQGGKGINVNSENLGKNQDKEAKKEEENSIKNKLEETINIINEYKRAIKVFDGTYIQPLMNKSYELVQYEKDLKKNKKSYEKKQKKKNTH